MSTLRRSDTTTEEQQQLFRGRHLMSDGRTGRAQGDRYYKCQCGWRVTDVPDTKRGRAQALEQFRLHLRDVGA